MPGFRERLKKAATQEELEKVYHEFVLSTYKLSDKSIRRCKKIYEEKVRKRT